MPITIYQYSKEQFWYEWRKRKTNNKDVETKIKVIFMKTLRNALRKTQDAFLQNIP